ncbi:serine/threonine-protein kinase RIO3-like [Babylonia areolata]|uniref:serine/threonine-protein kinase RIO3-like n=1 Tax=Babylonia areolata TaxID=304850 RepID=UPI003FCF4D11
MASSQTVSSPWGKAPVVVPCSLEDVMSEQLASQIQDGENQRTPQLTTEESFVQKTETLAVEPSEEDFAAILAAADANETYSDEMIARMLQLQFDREHNAMLDREAKQFNGSSKVTVSFENYKTQHPVYEEEDDEDYEDDELMPAKTKWEEKTPNMGSKGYAGSGKKITTKHDKVICGRKNAERLMEFPPEFESGDGEGMDMQLPNKVYNKLKKHSMTELKRRTRESEHKEHSTAEKAVDSKTRVLLFKLVNSGLLESIGGCFAEGKESAVFEGRGGSMEGVEVPQKVAVKVFKTTLLDFRTREKYVHGDHRFSSDDYKKQNPRKIIKIWAMKEVANLNRMRKFDVPCPRVVTLKKHVLVMSCIGDDKPAPKLHDIKLSVPDEQDAYEQTVEIMKMLHSKCSLVHADLSAYNLLWHDGTVYVIDVSQAVDLTHHQAFNFLFRDCTNISTHFQKRGVHGVLSPEQLFNHITGLDIHGEGAEFEAQVQRYDRERKECNMVLEQGYAQFGFDYFFDKAQQERASAATDLSSSPSQPSRKSLSAIVQKYVLESDNSSSGDEGAGEQG